MLESVLPMFPPEVFTVLAHKAFQPILCLLIFRVKNGLISFFLHVFVPEQLTEETSFSPLFIFASFE